jgi:acyl-CoA thioesterase
VGDLAAETALTGGDGWYTAKVSKDWEIWGPCGGYVAAIALRAAGEASKFDRPISFSCHYLGIAAFDAVDLVVTPLRSGRTTESLRVSMSQGGRPILEAIVLTVAEHEGLEHVDIEAPDVPDPTTIESVAERMIAQGQTEPAFPFWSNVDSRPIDWQETWPPSEPFDPTWRQWQRLLPEGTYDDPWVDAARSVLWIDLCGWPAASLPHMYKGEPWVAVNVDLYVAFHQPRPASAYLLVDAHSHIAAEGLMGYTSRIWSEDRALVASGGGQLFCRATSAVPNARPPS